MASYRVAAPDEYLAITGMGVSNLPNPYHPNHAS